MTAKQGQGGSDPIREHYEIEKRLASRLRNSTREERKILYKSLYNELFQRVPDHPQLKIKAAADASGRKVAYEMRHLDRFLKKGATFVEIGPGDCALSFAVAKVARKVYAIDVSEEITQNLAPPPNFQLILSDGAGIPVPAGSVDVAYSNQLMEHLHPDDAVEQLRNVYDALAPGGVYLCLTPNRFNGPHDVSKDFDQTATGFHLKEYTVTELSALFVATGFSRVRIFIPLKTFRPLFPVFPVRVFEGMLSRLPSGLRKPLASSWPAAKLLGIHLVGTKGM